MKIQQMILVMALTTVGMGARAEVRYPISASGEAQQRSADVSSECGVNMKPETIQKLGALARARSDQEAASQCEYLLRGKLGARISEYNIRSYCVNFGITEAVSARATYECVLPLECH